MIDWTVSVLIFDWIFASFFLDHKINQIKIESKSTIKQSTERFAVKVYDWLIDFAPLRENCPTGIIPEWMQKLTQHNGMMQYCTLSNFEKWFSLIRRQDEKRWMRCFTPADQITTRWAGHSFHLMLHTTHSGIKSEIKPHWLSLWKAKKEKENRTGLSTSTQ